MAARAFLHQRHDALLAPFSPHAHRVVRQVLEAQPTSSETRRPLRTAAPAPPVAQPAAVRSDGAAISAKQSSTATTLAAPAAAWGRPAGAPGCPRCAPFAPGARRTRAGCLACGPAWQQRWRRSARRGTPADRRGWQRPERSLALEEGGQLPQIGDVRATGVGRGALDPLEVRGELLDLRCTRGFCCFRVRPPEDAAATRRHHGIDDVAPCLVCNIPARIGSSTNAFPRSGGPPVAATTARSTARASRGGAAQEDPAAVARRSNPATLAESNSGDPPENGTRSSEPAPRASGARAL